MSKRKDQLIIEKLVKVPANDKRFWAREMKILYALAKTYSWDFLEFLVIDFKLNSLAFFKTKKGQEILKKEKTRFDLVKGEKKSKIEFKETEYTPIFGKTSNLKDKLGL